MALKNYSIRLDEKEYEDLRSFLSEYGDPELNIGYILRTYITDLNKALPHLKKSDLGIRSNLAFWGSMFRQLSRTAKIENMIKGAFDIDKALEKEDKKKN